MAGYCFLFWNEDRMFADEHLRRENLVRLFYYPLIGKGRKQTVCP